MPKKKPVNATVDELNEVRNELLVVIEALKEEAAIKVEVQEGFADFEARLEALSQEVNKNKSWASEALERVAVEARQHADAAAAGALKEATEQVEKQDVTRRLAEAALETKVDEVDKALRESFGDELTLLCENLDKQLGELTQELVGTIELRASEASDGRSTMRQELTRIIDRDRNASSQDRLKIREELAAESSDLLNELGALRESSSRQLQDAQAELSSCIDALTSTVSCNHELSNGAVAESREALTAMLEEFREQTEHHLAALDQRAIVLQDGVSEIRNGPTRRVEWLIRNASKVLQPPRGSEGHTAWFSPAFHAAGARNLRLELRRFEPDTESAGDCALFLWAGKGLHIAFRLLVGGKSLTFEKTYSEHMPHGARRFCVLKDQISAEDGVLHLGVELLEVVRQIEVSTMQADEVCNQLNVEAVEGVGEASLFEGSLICHRHTNNRMLPQVRREVDRMQARMVKRIEWLLEHASRLPQHFPNRQHICSPVFSAAGVEGIQLIFYPSGYSGATEGFCSFFLYCPAGVTIRSWLSVGKQRREINNTFEAGGTCGRTNFCRYEGLADEVTDTLLLVLEFEECRQDLSLLSVDAATQGELKLTRHPGHVVLTDTKVLPSIWTAKGLGDLTDTQKTPDGFHSFEVLKGRARTPPLTSAVIASTSAAKPVELTVQDAEPCSPTTLSPAVQRSASTPLLAPLARTTPLHTSSIEALPQLQGEWGSWSSSRTRKPRGLRKPTVLAAPPLLAAAP